MQKLSRVDSRYGAPMGRSNGAVAASPAPVKVSLGRVRLNSGGYDSGGAYWGWGLPLYRAMSDDGSISEFFRASSRDAAKASVRLAFPSATFYR